MIINILYVSLISSDTLLCVEDCERSKVELLKMQEALEHAVIDADKKMEWKDMVSGGIEICERDKAIFIEQFTPEYIEADAPDIEEAEELLA